MQFLLNEGSVFKKLLATSKRRIILSFANAFCFDLSFRFAMCLLELRPKLFFIWCPVIFDARMYNTNGFLQTIYFSKILTLRPIIFTRSSQKSLSASGRAICSSFNIRSVSVSSSSSKNTGTTC